MAHDEKTTVYIEPTNGASSRAISDALSWISKAEAEEAIEESFKPARDEETGSHVYPDDGSDEQIDPDIVDWDGPNDPENPMNWSRGRKWWISILTAFLTLVISFSSSVFSTASEATAEEFGMSSEVMILGVTLYVVGFACG